MKKFEFTKDYGKKKQGDVINMDMKIYHRIIHPLLMKGVLKVIQKDKIIREAVKEEIEQVPQDLFNALRQRKMNELRDLGRPYGAQDTKKDELVEEILDMVPSDKIKEFLGGD